MISISQTKIKTGGIYLRKEEKMYYRVPTNDYAI